MNSDESKKLIPGSRALPSTRQNSQRKQANYLLPTLFERLSDLNPNQLSEAPESYAINKEQMCEIITQDLTYLLNSMNLHGLFDINVYPLVASSTINYGVPPISGSFMAENRWENIEKMIRKAITDFEPRLIPDSLVVIPINREGIESNYNVLHFSISGKIYMQPYPLNFMVQSIFDLESNRVNFI